MVYVLKTLADCKQSLADRHESNGTLPTSSVTLAYWTRLLNKGVNYCSDKLRLTKTASLTTTSGSVALPDDFLGRGSVFIDDQEYTQVDEADVPAQTDYVYWITGNHTDGYTLNVPDDDTFSVTYSFRPAEMSSDSDVCIIPDIEAPVAYAYSFMRKAESDPFEDADTALQECDTRLKEMQSVKNINDNISGFSWK